MFIPIKQIKDWDDLQEKVKDFFIELGYRAQTNKEIVLANNGKAEVDVYAEKGDSPLAQKILFECKYWNSDVPRAIVQSFKMDVQEAGANFGIIVSKKGFQSGAYEGITLTTVKLYTFEELQTVFSNEWSRLNQTPLNELYQQLFHESRALEIDTPERNFHDKTAITPELKEKKEELENITRCVLGYINDYKLVNPIWAAEPPIKDSLKISPTKNLDIAFHDARSQAKEYNRILTMAINAWSSYKSIFETEFMKLSKEEMSKFFGSPN